MLGIMSIIWLIGIVAVGVYARYGDAICNFYWTHWSGLYKLVGITSRGKFFELQTISVTLMFILLMLWAVVAAYLYWREIR